jgi:hypothetical protein
VRGGDDASGESEPEEEGEEDASELSLTEAGGSVRGERLRE